MATLGANAVTLADVAKATAPDGSVAAVVEILGQTNEVLLDMLWKEGNLPTGNRTTVRTGLPDVTWRLLNQGTTASKATTAQIDHSCGLLDAWSEIDVKVAALNGNSKSFRMSQARAFLEAMNQEMASTLFYGNATTSPEEFTGLANHYNLLSAANGQNIVDADGTGSDNSSIWLVVWGAETIFGIYPKGSTGGLQHRDYGEVTVQDALGIAGSRLRALQEQFTWDCGLAVADWRFAVRIANIDISALVAHSSAADLTEHMIQAVHRIPSFGMGRAAFYVNRTIAEMLDIQRYKVMKGSYGSSQTAGGSISWGEIDGKNVPMFRGIPIRTVDALLETEARVV